MDKVDFEYTRDFLNSEECKSHYSSSNKTREPRSLHRSFPLIILSFSLKKPNPEYKVSQTKVLVFPKLSFLYHLCALNKIIRNHHDPTAGRFNFESKECKLEKNIDFAGVSSKSATMASVQQNCRGAPFDDRGFQTTRDTFHDWLIARSVCRTRSSARRIGFSSAMRAELHVGFSRTKGTIPPPFHSGKTMWLPSNVAPAK